MNQDEIAVLLIMGCISALPDADQAKIKECKNKILMLRNDFKDAWIMAVALVGAELQQEANKS